jgi:hypothetical protein
MNELKSYYKMMPDSNTYTPSNILLNTDILFEDTSSTQLSGIYDKILTRIYNKLYSTTHDVDAPNIDNRVADINGVIKYNPDGTINTTKPKKRITLFNPDQLQQEEDEEKDNLNRPRVYKPNGEEATKEVLPIEMNEDEYRLVSDIINTIRDKDDSYSVTPETKYFLKNRSIFINFINKIFSKYKDEYALMNNTLSCDTMVSTNKFALLLHQKLISDYINIYTPYRGLLLFHGLGSGKTCSSIAIAEQFKNTNKKIIVMTPASLLPNYVKELKKCGNIINRLNNNWEWVSYDSLGNTSRLLEREMNLPVHYIKKHGGVWVISNKSSTQKTNKRLILTTADTDVDERELVNDDNTPTIPIIDNNDIKPKKSKQTKIVQQSINQQLDEMIKNKYLCIGYNGLRKSHMTKLTHNHTINPFDNSVTIIDETHKFISPIVNKIRIPNKKDKISPDSSLQAYKDVDVSLQLYHYLLSAKNARIILLTGTPIMNYPNELAVLYNIINGYLVTYECTLLVKTTNKINNDTLIDLLKKTNIYKYLDYINYSPSTRKLTVVLNPEHFINVNTESPKYEGVAKSVDFIGEENEDTTVDSVFTQLLSDTLKENNIEASNFVKQYYKQLPDSSDEFQNRFYSNSVLINKPQLMSRISGLTSYFSGTPELLPRYKKEDNYHIELVPMSNYQFDKYVIERSIEKKSEKKNNQKSDIFKEQSSTYKLFSRLVGLFALPDEIGRPKPRKSLEELQTIDDPTKTSNKDAMPIEKVIVNPMTVANDDPTYVSEPNLELPEENDVDYLLNKDKQYMDDIRETLRNLSINSDKYLTMEALENYSPKMNRILENLKNPDNIGLHLVYSQFRTLEGLGIFKLALNQNGFAEFSINKNKTTKLWEINIRPEDIYKPKYVSYTGAIDSTEKEKKEILLNIYNGFFDNIPKELSEQITQISPNNNFGEIIKVFMITSSGAEGLDLKNTRYVHIMEPFWNLVRIEQVIGRAVRICSHKNLPPELRNVEAYVYISCFTPEQIKKNKSLDIMISDLSKTRGIRRPITTDESLYETSIIKDDAISQLIKTVKETSIDCNIYPNNENENLVCYNPTPSLKYSYKPNYEDDINTTTFKDL